MNCAARRMANSILAVVILIYFTRKLLLLLFLCFLLALPQLACSQNKTKNQTENMFLFRRCMCGKQMLTFSITLFTSAFLFRFFFSSLGVAVYLHELQTLNGAKKKIKIVCDFIFCRARVQRASEMCNTCVARVHTCAASTPYRYHRNGGMHCANAKRAIENMHSNFKMLNFFN